MPRKSKPMPMPQAHHLQLAREFAPFLRQTEGLPYPDRWPMTMELLPESLLCRIIRARQHSSELEMMNYLGPIAMVMMRELFPDYHELKADAAVATVALMSLVISCLAEMERRHKQFCTEVTHMSDPFNFNPDTPVHYVPKDPETFDIQAMYRYYDDLCNQEPL